MLPATIRDPFFRRSTRHQFIEQGLAFFGTQDSTQALDVFALCAVAAHDDSDAAVRDIHPLIEHTPCDQLAVLAGAEAFQNNAPLLSRRFVGDAGHAEAAANLIYDIIVF